MSQRVSETYTINAEAKYIRVYNGTVYTITWKTPDGVEHKATCRNADRLLRFARNGFSLAGLRSVYGIKVVE